MRYFKVLEITNVPADTVVMLNNDQASRRAHKVELIDEHPDGDPVGIYRTTKSCQFKIGEFLGIDGDMGKHAISKFVEVDKDGEPLEAVAPAPEPDGDKAPAKAKAKAPAKAKAAPPPPPAAAPAPPPPNEGSK